jgi:hypothetical protein
LDHINSKKVINKKLSAVIDDNCRQQYTFLSPTDSEVGRSCFSCVDDIIVGQS